MATNRNRLLPRLLATCLLIVSAATVLVAPNIAISADSRATNVSDHLRTGFALTGRHAQIECQECHVGGTFKGTPRLCALCHVQGSRTAATFKPVNHAATNQPCEVCHTSTVTWAGARFQHIGIAPGSCMSCHNGTTASSKPARHPVTTASCDTCHRTTAWLPAAFNHAGVAPGSCITCHNGTTATGKTANHVITTASCDTCHRTTAWLPASFSHATVAPGSCITCHNGTTATGKPTNHVATSASCDTCHRTTAWIPATFSHTAVAPGSCGTCHNGTTATGKSATHFVTARSCDACHTTTAWIPARHTHLSAAYKPHNAGVTCRGCHTTNNEVISWSFAAYAPDCAGCHANRFKPDPHKKTETPTTTFYTVAELKNCAGSCHIYNGTTGAITRTRNSQHRSTDGGF